MDTSDKIAIIGIIENAIIAIGGLLWAIKNKRTIQPTFASATPVAKPKKKHLLSPLEQRVIRQFRIVQIVLSVSFIHSLLTDLVIYPIGLSSKLEYAYWIVTLVDFIAVVGILFICQRMITRIKRYDLPLMLRLTEPSSEQKEKQ